MRTNANNYGNSDAATVDGTKLTISAFATTGAGGVFQTANVANWGAGSGFGVRDRDEGLSVNSPNHAMDNAGNTDMLALSFTIATTAAPVSVIIDSLTVGWKSTDSDLSLLRWTGAGGPTILGGTFASLLSAGWVLENHYANMPEDAARATGATLGSSWWLISA